MDAASTSAKPQVFRSPFAVGVWWLWLLFAVGNLIDLAVQGRDHLSLVAAFVLVLITGVIYLTALRPCIIVEAEGLTLVNPLRDHRICWAAISGIDAADLVRVRCAWPREPDGESAHRVIYSWAVHSSRRRQAVAEMRAQQLSRGKGGLNRGRFAEVPRSAGLPTDTEQVVTNLTERKAEADSGQPAVAPVSTWRWQALAALAVPALALAIVALA